jgi:hypothetical protein
VLWIYNTPQPWRPQREEGHLGEREGCYGFITTPNPGDYHEKKAIWVNESGFYSMVLGSRKPYCVAFQRWVMQEVLPSIRRTGQYTRRVVLKL